MPEIKRTFTAGKMNKDLDERLVRNGEYRDAKISKLELLVEKTVLVMLG